MPGVEQCQTGAPGLPKDSPTPVPATATCSWVPASEAALTPLPAHWIRIHMSRLPGPTANGWARVSFQQWLLLAALFCGEDN